MGSAEMDGFLTRMGVMGFYPLGIWFLTLIAWILKAFMFMGNALIAYPVTYECLGVSEISQNGTGENGYGKISSEKYCCETQLYKRVSRSVDLLVRLTTSHN